MGKVSDMEVETMLVNGRLYVSANTQKSAKDMAGLNLQSLLKEAAKAFVSDNAKSAALRQYRIGVIGEALAVIDDQEDLTPEQLKGAELLGEYQFGYHAEYDARADLSDMLKLLQNQVRNQLVVRGPFSTTAAAATLTDKDYRGHVMSILPPDDKSHAEQYLALTLAEGRFKGRAVIAGTKNPCSCCWLTLTLMLQKGYDVRFNNFAGAYWPKSARGVALVAQELGVDDVGTLMEYFRRSVDMTGTDHFRQHVTALQEVGLKVTVPARGGGMSEKHLTQDQTARSVLFVNNPAFSTETLPAEFGEIPGSPVQTYGTPLHDPDYMEEDLREKEHAKNLKDWEELDKQAALQKEAREKRKKKETDKVEEEIISIEEED